jgi:hypothetical protein
MQRRVTPEALKLTSELTQQQGMESWWVCDEYRRRGQEIVARYSPPWINAPDSPPWTGEEELHWRSYAPLKETPDLFLKLARLHQESEFEEATLAFSHRYGVLGAPAPRVASQNHIETISPISERRLAEPGPSSRCMRRYSTATGWRLSLSSSLMRSMEWVTGPLKIHRTRTFTLLFKELRSR